MGLTVTKDQLLDSVLVKTLNKKHTFASCRPGRNCYEGFLKRNTNFYTRKAINSNTDTVYRKQYEAQFRDLTGINFFFFSQKLKYFWTLHAHFKDKLDIGKFKAIKKFTCMIYPVCHKDYVLCKSQVVQILPIDISPIVILHGAQQYSVE